jgi:hypothetical protein
MNEKKVVKKKFTVVFKEEKPIFNENQIKVKHAEEDSSNSPNIDKILKHNNKRNLVLERVRSALINNGLVFESPTVVSDLSVPESNQLSSSFV